MKTALEIQERAKIRISIPKQSVTDYRMRIGTLAGNFRWQPMIIDLRHEAWRTSESCGVRDGLPVLVGFTGKFKTLSRKFHGAT